MKKLYGITLIIGILGLIVNIINIIINSIEFNQNAIFGYSSSFLWNFGFLMFVLIAFGDLKSKK